MKICSTHKVASEWKTGTSKKTGKDYAFWACPQKDGDSFCQAEQIEGVLETKEQDSKPDWDAISRGKVRHGVVVAVIEHGGLEGLAGQFDRIERVVEFVMSGKNPANGHEQGS